MSGETGLFKHLEYSTIKRNGFFRHHKLDGAERVDSKGGLTSWGRNFGPTFFRCQNQRHADVDVMQVLGCFKCRWSLLTLDPQFCWISCASLSSPSGRMSNRERIAPQKTPPRCHFAFILVDGEEDGISPSQALRPTVIGCPRGGNDCINCSWVGGVMLQYCTFLNGIQKCR